MGYFDDIRPRRWIGPGLYTPDMEDVVPKAGGLLGGFDYRKPFENETPGFAVLSRGDTGADAPTISAGHAWIGKGPQLSNQAPENLPPGVGSRPSLQNISPGSRLDSGLTHNPFELPPPNPSGNAYDSRLAPNRAEDLRRPEVRAFLDAVSVMEGAGYHTLFGDSRYPQGRLAPDLSFFPNRKAANTKSASGAFQIQRRTYDGLAQQMGLSGFDPRVQDLMAAQLLQNANGGVVGQTSALEFLREGKFDAAVDRANKTWTALPGGEESRGTLEEMRAIYEERLKRYTSTPPMF